MTKSTGWKLVMAGALLGGLLGVACGGDDDESVKGNGDAADSGVAECPLKPVEMVTPPVTECLSYQPAADGMCAGVYCKLNQEQLAPKISEGGACGGDPEFTCRGTLTNIVGACARKVKGENIALNNCQLRPLIQDCVYEDAEVKEKVTEECLGCFLDAAECAGDNCLVQCLTGDNQQCDACRMQYNCTQKVFSCGGLPDPFAT